ncbi:MAG: HAD-IIIA family hydrolase [Bacteroidales bacterium]|nr:HAD-IIIA family hydrolase [Bacteroidales bacterium]
MVPNIKAIILDVDGTLTDGKIYMSDNGEIMKAFNIKDGYALARLSKSEITPIIITGRKSKIVEKRAQELKITEVHQGIDDKLPKLLEVCERLHISPSQCAYIGDDLNDMECMQACGLKACPSDAVQGIKEVVDYVCKSKGGEGAVREFCDYIIF